MNVDIISLLIRSGIELERKGDKYAALCPFHNDKDTPSLVIYPVSNSWTCFSANCPNPKHSGKRNGGDGIDFIMQLHKCDYYDAKKWIADNFEPDYEPIVFVQRPKKQLPKIEDKNIQYWHSLLDFDGQREWFKDRGLLDSTINKHALGFDGANHIIPIWNGKPRESECLCVKRRSHNGGVKYIRFGSFSTNVYNFHSCKKQNTIYGFAGELDALLANQDGLPSFSLIDGAGSYNDFNPNDFDAMNLVVVFDRKEEVAGAKLANIWCKSKGLFTAKILHWPDFDGTDYTDFRRDYTFSEFMSLCEHL